MSDETRDTKKTETLPHTNVEPAVTEAENTDTTAVPVAAAPVPVESVPAPRKRPGFAAGIAIGVAATLILMCGAWFALGMVRHLIGGPFPGGPGVGIQRPFMGPQGGPGGLRGGGGQGGPGMGQGMPRQRPGLPGQRGRGLLPPNPDATTTPAPQDNVE